MDHQAFFFSGFVVGWSVAAIFVFAVTLFYMPDLCDLEKVMMWRRRRRRRRRRKNKKKTKQKPAQGSQNPTINDRSEDTKIRTLRKYITRMSFGYLLKATENFSKDHVIGLGKLGTLYRAGLGNGNFLAVKRFRDSPHLDHHFISEIMTIGRLRHRNLVPLLGFCIERKERLLAYNYMANGSLYGWLHPMEPERCTLDWPVRVRITIGIARGLAWLHHKCKPRITHGKICSKCILLDKNFDPKISNFREKMVTKSSCCNPELRIFVNGESGELGDNVASKHECLAGNPKNDVYAFGILLLEVVTGEKPNNLSKLSEAFSGTLFEWMSTDSFYGAIDKSLIGQGFDGEISRFLKVASNCIRPSSNERPTMLEVYNILSAIGAENGTIGNFLVLKRIEGRSANHIDEHATSEIVDEIE